MNKTILERTGKVKVAAHRVDAFCEGGVGQVAEHWKLRPLNVRYQRHLHTKTSALGQISMHQWSKRDVIDRSIAVPRHSVLKANVRQQLKERLNMSSLLLLYLVVVTNELRDPCAEVYRTDLQGKAAEVNRLLLDVRQSSFTDTSACRCRLLGPDGTRAT